MPVLRESSYGKPLIARFPHLHTIVAAKIRRESRPPWIRERIDTPDGDFLDIDVWVAGRDQAVILQHGLEGSSERTYMRGMARALFEAGFDVLAVNFRGCSGEPNRMPRSYHSGATEDLRAVLDHFDGRYARFGAVGFSLGGNMLLKYLREEGEQSRIASAVAVSVPCDLEGSADRLAEPSNRLYMWNFMRSLRKKVQQKAAQFPERISTESLDEMRTFHEFDDRYTAPLHGYRDAQDYWTRCSGRGFIEHICVPTLLLNAQDDPFFSESCFPVEACAASDHVTLEMPPVGGHVGFLQGLRNGRRTYAEERAAEFLTGAGQG
ncbi:MAG: alpha/beta fold hydrolase [Bacteroidota bacterium]|nr:alpha/beta fold hydrolase [Bacteroidota bacterium]